MKIIAVLFSLFLANTALASDGETVGCFGLALSVPNSLEGDGAWTSLRVPGSLCVTEKNMVETGDEFTATGKITIVIRDGNGKRKATYSLTARSSEGAAGSTYTIYGNDINKLTPDDFDIVQFRMRNDHVKKGQVAGSVRINGTYIELVQK